jgi:hypothetical protein
LGLNSFEMMAGVLDRINQLQTKMISKQDYELFHKEYIFDQLKGSRYGEAFCKRFQIDDPVVSRIIDADLAIEMIEEIYIK